MTPAATHLRAYRVELDLTTAQRRWCERACAASRVTYNWGLAEWRRWYRWQRITDTGKRDRALRLLARWGAAEPTYSGKPSAYGLSARLTQAKKADLAWLHELGNAYVPREAIAALGKAYAAFFRRLKKHRAGDHSECGKSRRGRCSLGAPRFHARRSDEGFVCDQSNAIQTERVEHVRRERGGSGRRRVEIRSRLCVPGLGWVNAKPGQYLPRAAFDAKAPGVACTCARATGKRGKHKPGCDARSGAWVGDPGVELCGVGIRRWGGRWYAAVRARAPIRGERERQPDTRMAVEVGVRYRAVTFDGARVGAFADTRTDRRALKLERKRNVWERRMARRWQAGVAKRDQSAGWREARAEVSRLHRELAQLRADRIHHVSRAIVNSGAAELVVRDMRVKDLLQRGAASDPRVRTVLADDVQKSGMAELRRQLEYKQRWGGGTTTTIASDKTESKQCAVCGTVRERAPGYPWFVCPGCGHGDDRDANAARVRHNYDQRTPYPGDPVGCPGTPGGKSAEQSAARMAVTTESPGSGSSELGAASDGAVEHAPPGALGSGNGARRMVRREKSGARKGSGRPGTAGMPAERLSDQIDDAREHRGDARVAMPQIKLLASPADGLAGDRSQTGSQPSDVAGGAT